MLKSLAALAAARGSLVCFASSRALLIIQHGMGKIIGFPVVAMYATVQPLSLVGCAGLGLGIDLLARASRSLDCARALSLSFLRRREMAFAFISSGTSPRDFIR